jgi:hypothetical protein
MIYINEVEAASELATKATYDELVVRGEYKDEDDLYEEDEESGDLRFKEQVQDVYDDWYDFYFDLLTTLDVKKGADGHIFL